MPCRPVSSSAWPDRSPDRPRAVLCCAARGRDAQRELHRGGATGAASPEDLRRAAGGGTAHAALADHTGRLPRALRTAGERPPGAAGRSRQHAILDESGHSTSPRPPTAHTHSRVLTSVHIGVMSLRNAVQGSGRRIDERQCPGKCSRRTQDRQTHRRAERCLSQYVVAGRGSRAQRERLMTHFADANAAPRVRRPLRAARTSAREDHQGCRPPKCSRPPKRSQYHP